jgi:hypothetical protein
MAILADSCAGTQKALTTDRAESHSALTRWITLTKGGEFKAGPYKKDAEDYKRLVSISLRVIDSRRFELRNLISLRQREEREGGHSLRDLRHRYLTKINECTDKLATQARTQGDKAEIERAFEQEMKDDLKALQNELRAHGKKTLLSKELAVAVVASAGVVVEPVVSSVLGIGALGKLKVEYREGRNKVLRNHSMSWLYEPSKAIHLY